jgi:uncharacterized protein YjiS (DUF1127 family)
VTTQSCKADRAISAGILVRTSEQIRSAFLQLLEVAWIWRARIRARRALGQFDDHTLKDIGMSRADVYRETAKPFWRD